MEMERGRSERGRRENNKNYNGGVGCCWLEVGSLGVI